MSPTGAATYEGDPVGFRAAGGAATKFLADVEMVADFDGNTVGGTVDEFRTLSRKALDAPTVTLPFGPAPLGASYTGWPTSD